jgi:catalase
VESILNALKGAGAKGEIIGPHLGVIEAVGGSIEATKTFAGTSSVLYDAVFVPGGLSVSMLNQSGDAHAFIAETYKHAKAIGASGEGSELIKSSLPVAIADPWAQPGVTPRSDTATAFIDAIGTRHWGREAVDQIAV